MRRAMIDFYVDSVSRAKDIRPSTAEQIADMLNRVFDQLEEKYGVSMEEEKISGLSGAKIQRWFNDASVHWKPATVNSYVNTLNPFLRWAAKMSGDHGDYVQKDFSKILQNKKIPDPDKLPEDQRPKDKYFTVEQVEMLLHGTETHARNLIRDRAIIAVFLFSGLRVSELCQIKAGDFMGEKPKEEQFVRVQRKGGVWKDVEIGDRAYPYVQKYLATRKNVKPEEPLFLTTHGKPCSRNQIYKALSFKQKELGIATGPHAFRHTALSGIDKVSSASIARDVANHKNFKITNRYVHSSREERLNALNALPWA